ncbi:type II toxin-antitoxin system VapC family toxin [Mucilaginibacter sp.]|jgi:predicted nucleic acid-binding protein|uniref:type II toxin-antitoxin system VapC family toxin n=1 Tax=Mucilaginibacter sp. TaxID=1882438 RepID=UPI002C877578|nr:type II toxin-antitoxin system VapC family toxin [Mucilaginibacter sp.]HTI59074.1 type II toxin-antitoxin system VapC family toxin [Mucilaginibacter sp.]
MGKKYLIDSNILIEYAGNLFPKNIHSALSTIVDDDFIISFITKIEVLGHYTADRAWHNFINLASIFGADDNIIEQTILLRRDHKIKVPDAIIAATALVNNYTLLTRNIADFKKIPNLKMENPWLWEPDTDVS